MKKQSAPSSLSKYDTHDMRSMLLDFPRQFGQGIDAARNASLPSIIPSVESIIIAGMGGSALPGELLKFFARQSSFFKYPIDVHIHREYGLPADMDKRTLIVCISYSGNTEETLSAYREARKQNLPLAVISSGGMLEELAQKQPMWIKLPPSDLPPRLAIGMQFAALVTLLERLSITSPQTKKLETAALALHPGLFEQKTKTIAKKTFLRIPIIYASRANKALAYIMKIGFNENAKKMAFWNYIPECNHNEMVGFGDTHKNFIFFFLLDRDDNPAIKKRIRIMIQLAKKNRIPLQILDITNSRVYNKAFNTILLSDWISYYSALFNKTDPTPVSIVEE